MASLTLSQHCLEKKKKENMHLLSPTRPLRVVIRISQFCPASCEQTNHIRAELLLIFKLIKCILSQDYIKLNYFKVNTFYFQARFSLVLYYSYINDHTAGSDVASSTSFNYVPLQLGYCILINKLLEYNMYMSTVNNLPYPGQYVNVDIRTCCR